MHRSVFYTVGFVAITKTKSYENMLKKLFFQIFFRAFLLT